MPTVHKIGKEVSLLFGIELGKPPFEILLVKATSGIDIKLFKNMQDFLFLFKANKRVYIETPNSLLELRCWLSNKSTT